MSLRTLYDEASLWMTPSGYEDGKLFSELPTDGSGDFTFSRGSNLAATRVGPTGLIEKGRENLIPQSNQFDTTWVAANGATISSGEVGYDGTNDAWLLTKSTNNFSNINQSVSASGVNTYSVYAKGTSTNFCLRDNVSGTRLEVDLNDGSIALQQSGIIVANVQDVGSGWYRVSATFNEVLSVVQIYPKFNSADVVSVTIQDAQLEIGLAATDYIESGATTGKAGLLENEPRLDYSGGATCPSLLLEPQRTNLFTQSEYFSSYWVSNGGTRTHNQSTSPDGGQNATEFLFNSFASGVYTPAFAAGTYTMSIFIKPISGDGLIRLGMGLDNSQLNTSTLAITNQGTGNGSLIDYGNGWYRFITTITTSTSTSANIYNLNNNEVRVYIYGAQIEQASYQTSYIPTHGSSVTRNFDNATTTSEEDVLTSGEGIVFMEFEINDTTITGYPEVIRIENPSDTTDKFWFYIFDDSDAGEIRFGYRLDDTAVKKVEGSVTLDAMTTAKVAMRLENNNYALYYNGTKQTPTQYAGVVSNLRKITTRGREHFNGLRVKQFAIFNEALSDSELATLTTL